MENTCSVVNKTKATLPRLPLLSIKDDILGKKYFLSVAYVGEKISRELNKKWRGKDKPTNVLSFALRKNEGELILCPSVVRKEAKNFGKSFDEFLGFLVIHGMLHLKGLDHSSTMEKAESKYDQKYFYRNRRRLGSDSSGGRRIRERRKNS